jgi:hypothetical protein
MNPDERRKLNEIYAWMQAKRKQQLTLPVDAASIAALGALTSHSFGSSDLTDTITIGAGGGSASVPKAYVGTLWVVKDGAEYEVPYLNKA